MKKLLSKAKRFAIQIYSPMITSILQHRTQYPTVINLNITNLCDSHCQMCNIWRNTDGTELSVDQISDIFSSHLFRKATHVGITGGEPTLRNDLIKVASAIIDSSPSLKSLSIITNAIQPLRSFRCIQEMNQLCKERGIAFGVMISLDGFGEIHDKQRGTKGNFKSVLNLLDLLKNNGFVNTTLGATITHVNCYHAHELLAYAKTIGIQIRFRIAEHILRLNNADSTVIRNFSDTDSYHLYTFFHYLETQYEIDSSIQRTYRSIQNMLLGGQRLIGCPYQNKGLVLGATGKISYCAVHGRELGSALKSNIKNTYLNSKKEKKRIRMLCSNCIHDYHNPELWNEAFRFRILPALINLIFHWSKSPTFRHAFSLTRFMQKSTHQFHWFIIGWYGTETCGDKAILGGILQQIRSMEPDATIAVSSLYPHVTEQTRIELQENFHVIPTRSIEYLRTAFHANKVVIGGGPLMHLNELQYLLLAFQFAMLKNNERIIWGCGIGPLANQYHSELVSKLISLSTSIKLRDSKSLEHPTLFKALVKPSLIDDPAIDYIKSIQPSIKPLLQKTPEVCCFFRELSHEYFPELSKNDFLKFRTDYEYKLALWLKMKCDRLGILKITLLHMHTFSIGNDDRMFSYRFILEQKMNLNGLDIQISPITSNVKQIVKAMQNSQLNICMRYHSVVFAETCGVNFIAIDYTRGEKIFSFLSERNQVQKMVSIEQILHHGE